MGGFRVLMAWRVILLAGGAQLRRGRRITLVGYGKGPRESEAREVIALAAARSETGTRHG
jgi:hypothetical protein